MKEKIILLIILFFGISAFAQSKYRHGNPFDFDSAKEKDVKLVSGDKDSYFMYTRMNGDNFGINNKITVRKFDNTNTLKETFVHEMPQLEKFAYINYLGSIDAGNKIVFITETYAGKLKKKNIYKIIFDKTAGTFTDDLLATFPIESVMKSGTAYFEKSENGRYGAVVFYEHAPRKEAAQINVTVLDTGSLKTVWSKKITGEPGSSDSHFFVANSGNVGLIRSAAQNAMMLYVTPSGQEEKFFTEKMKIISETAVSIGDKEYFIAFNSLPKTIKVNAANFENLMLYDVAEGKIISNQKSTAYDDGSKIVEVYIPYTTVSGDKIYLFTESRLNNGTRTVNSPMNTMTMTETHYVTGDPRLTVIDAASGNIDVVSSLDNNSSRVEELDVHSFGIANVRGNFILKTGNLANLNLVNLDAKTVTNLKDLPLPAATNAPVFNNVQNIYNQALLYRPEVKSLYFPRSYDGGKSAAIVSLENFEGR